MRNLIFFILSLVLSTICKGQSESNRILIKDFVEYITTKNFATDTIVLGEEPNMTHFPSCTWMFSDTTLISSSEKKFILKEIDNPLIKEWSKELVNKSKFVTWKAFIGILRDSTRRWPYFYKNYGTNFISYSSPIFFRNNTMCLFYWDQLSSSGGDGQIGLYKKENNEWIMVKEFCEWRGE
jgi:hypothetical protein